jgi:hypothetical protein
MIQTVNTQLAMTRPAKATAAFTCVRGFGASNRLRCVPVLAVRGIR